MQHTAESSQHAVTALEDQTREAFGRTETALGSVQDELVSNAQKITNLEIVLMEERHRHAQDERRMYSEQKAIVARLTQ